MDTQSNEDSSVTSLGEESVDLAPLDTSPTANRMTNSPNNDKYDGSDPRESPMITDGTSVPSPATQTLNILSQHDAIGGGSLLFDTSTTSNNGKNASEETTPWNDTNGSETTRAGIVHKPKDASLADHQDLPKSPIKEIKEKPSNPTNCTQSILLQRKNLSIQNVTLTEPGSLGMIVSRGEGTCRVKQVVKGTQAEQAGIQPGDILLSGHHEPVSFDQVLAWTTRPIVFAVARQKLTTEGAEESSTVESSRLQQDSGEEPKNAVSPKSKPSHNSRYDSSTDSDAEVESDQTVPFCPACVEGSNVDNNGAAHHELCPKHPTFAVSGAKEKLDKIRQGVKAKCTACQYEYQHGRRNRDRHSCPRAKPVSNNKSQSQLTVSSFSGSITQDSTETEKSSHNPFESVPFCLGCKNYQCKDAVHDKLCPKHPTFSSSGAKEKLAKIQRGVKAGCIACEYEYKHGRRSKYQRHSCERRAKSVSNKSQTCQSPLSVSSYPGITEYTETENKDYESVPFCIGCNKDQGKNTSRVVHHAMCPKNPHFHVSGEKKKLEKLQLGVRQGCIACQYEYEHGRPKWPHERHTCERRKSRQVPKSLPQKRLGSSLHGDPNHVRASNTQRPKSTTATKAKASGSSPALDTTIPSASATNSRSKDTDQEASDASHELPRDSVQFLDESSSMNQSNSNSRFPANSPAAAEDRLAEPESPLPTKKEPAVPFCRACNDTGGRTALFHHAMCPEHPQFENSGADKALVLIRRGVAAGCTACAFQYHNGRVGRHLVHSRKCERRKKTTTDKTKESGNSLKETSRKTGNKRSKPASSKDVDKRKSRRKSEQTDISDVPEDAREQSAKAERSGKRKARKQSTKAPKKSGKTGDAAETELAKHGPKERTESDTASLQEPSSKRTRRNSKKTSSPLMLHEEQEPLKKPSWVPCHNPWGSAGHVVGDVVLFCPSGGFTHHESLDSSQRFSLDPFSPQSCYFDSHQSPQEGYHVIRLSRDRMASRPWGFTCRRHDFGGACLVKSVDPLSPAATAVHVGYSERNEFAGLSINDMILCANGKLVGGLTETGLSVELDVSGSELLLVVSRHKHQTSAQQLERVVTAGNQSDDAGGLYDWIDLGGILEASREDDQHSVSSCEARKEESYTAGAGSQGSVGEAQATIGKTQAPERKESSLSEAPRIFSSDGASCSSTDTHSLDTDENATKQRTPEAKGENSHSHEDEWEDDEEPWLGCVCSEIHPKPIPVFWIQCDICDAWYSVSESCVGFNQSEGEELKSWSCWACSDPADGNSQEEVGPSEYELKRLQNIARNNARLEELGLLKKDASALEPRPQKTTRNKPPPCESIPTRRSTRTRKVSKSAPPCTTPAQSQGSADTDSTSTAGKSAPTSRHKAEALTSSSKDLEILKPGTVVNVYERTWPGSEK